MSYRILRKISEGGFSEIFEVLDPQSALRESLILKRLNPEMSAHPEVRAAFTKEGEILANLRHPNIVTFRRCYYDRGHICLVMERVEGEDFMTWVRRHQDRPQAAIDAFRQILEAVDHLHHRSTPLLHLDLKPENVLMTMTGGAVKPILIDFGIARGAGGPGLRAYTPDYAAPEQQRNGRLGCYTDVYALGQILDELLRELRQSMDPASLRAFQAVADRARSRSRGRRYSEAGEMLSAFRAARATSRASTSRPTPTLSPRVTMAAALAILTLVGVIFLGLVGTSWVGGGDRRAGGRAGKEPASEPLAKVGYELSTCPQLESVVGDLEAFSQGVDVCIEEALQSNQLGMMNERYVQLVSLIQRSQLDAGTEETMARKLDDFKREIDVRTVPLVGR